MDAINAGILEATSESRDEISKIARSVISLSHEGNIQARRIIDANTGCLIQLVAKVHALSGLEEDFPIVVTGGLGAAETLYRTLIVEKITALFPQAKIRDPRMTPVEAAAVFALRNSKAEF
jgi:N-acetylglucosamine kinase-like BadF-type ATPase